MGVAAKGWTQRRKGGRGGQRGIVWNRPSVRLGADWLETGRLTDWPRLAGYCPRLGCLQVDFDPFPAGNHVAGGDGDDTSSSSSSRYAQNFTHWRFPANASGSAHNGAAAGDSASDSHDSDGGGGGDVYDSESGGNRVTGVPVCVACYELGHADSSSPLCPYHDPSAQRPQQR